MSLHIIAVAGKFSFTFSLSVLPLAVNQVKVNLEIIERPFSEAIV